MTLPLDIETPAVATLPAAAGSTPGTVLAPGESGVADKELGEGSTSATHALSFIVHGLPAPQGSKRGYVVNGRAVLVESSKRVKPWREAVKQAALDKLDGDTWAAGLTGPLMLTVVYTLPRPKSHYRTGRHAHLLRDKAPRWPASKPDVGKLTRATEDAITDSGMWRDDAQVVVSLSVKTYADVHPRALTTPGAYIRITPMPAASA